MAPLYTLERIIKGMTMVEERLCELAGLHHVRGLVFGWDEGAPPRLDAPSMTLRIRGAAEMTLTFTVEEIAAYPTGVGIAETEARIRSMALMLQRGARDTG